MTSRTRAGTGARGPRMVSEDRRVFWLAALPVLALLVAVHVLIFHGQDHAYRLFDLAPLINIVFSATVSLAVAGLLARTALTGGSLGPLWLGCGLLVAGLGSLVTGVPRLLGAGPSNFVLTTSNLCYLAAFACYAASAVVTTLGEPGPTALRARTVVLAYAGAGLFAVLTALAAFQGALPEFILPGQGPRPPRHVTFHLSALLLAVAMTLFAMTYRRTKARFALWLSLALALHLVAVIGLMYLTRFHSPLNWAARAARYLGDAYFLLAALAVVREARVSGVRVEEVVRDLFRQPELGYRFLREAELREARRVARLGGWYWDARSGEMFGTEEFYHLFGLDPAEPLPALEEQKDRIYPAESWERMNAAVRQALRTGQGFDMDVEAFRQGVSIWASLRCEADRSADGRVVGLRGLVQDITERKRLEEDLRRSRDELESRVEARTRELARTLSLLRGITEGASDLIAALDRGMRFTSFNAAFKDEMRRLFGAEVREGTRLDDLFAGSPDRLRQARGYWSRALGGEEFAVVERIEEARGDSLYLEVRYSPIRDERGETVGAAHIVRNVTDRMLAQERINRYAAQLEAKNKELQEFSYIASHDLQEPLRKVQAFGQRLRDEYGGALGEEGSDYLWRMERAAARMQALINDLLDYSRVATRAKPFVVADLGEAAREATADLDRRIEETGGRIEIGGLPTAEVDRTQMRQAFQNLFSNALKYHGQEPPLVRVSGEVVGAGGRELVRIAVRDNGIGFDEKYAQRIFEPFQRLHGRNAYEGSGIGLAIVRKIIERHGGTITARSAPGQGSTFLFELPVRQPEA